VWHLHLNQSGSQPLVDHEWSDFLLYIVFAVFKLDAKESSEFHLSGSSLNSNLSGSSLEHDSLPLQIDFLVLDVRAGKPLT
jgi:hypothetical protein